MNKVISLNGYSSLTNEVFLKEIWNNFYECLKKKENIILDLQSIDFIESAVIPKLCCLGVIVKKNGLWIKLVPSYKVREYLTNLNFWNIIYSYDIFQFEQRYLEYEPTDEKVTNAFFCLDKDSLRRKHEPRYEFDEDTDVRNRYKLYVKAELVGEGNVYSAEHSYKNIPKRCQDVIRAVSHLTDYSEYTSEDKIIDALVELVHNSVWHSEGTCFVLIQACTYKREKSRIGVEISVSDTGMGLYKSLVKKSDEFSPKYYRKDKFIRISDKLTQNYCSIFEALFYRKESTHRGLYDIMHDLATEPDGIYTELNLINGNVSLHMKKQDISKLLSGGVEIIHLRKKKYMNQKRDIGYSFSIDMYIKK